MRRLVQFLGGLVVVLLLLAFDERRTTEAFEAARDRLAPLVAKTRTALGGRAAPAPPPSASGAWPVLYGEWASADDAPTGDLLFVGAEIRLQTGEVWSSRPLRIAYGREALARPLKLGETDQIELRRLAGPKGEPLAGSAVCAGDAPAYVGLRRDPDRLRMMVFRAGPAPDQSDPGPALCGVWSYRKR